MDGSTNQGLAPMLNYLEGSRSSSEDDFLADVIAGLSTPGQKTLPCKYFYDQRGSALFDQICKLDEYYVTRTELALLRTHARDMADCIGPRAEVIELGSGSSIKIRLLLDALEAPASYVPIDISTDHLAAAAAQIAEDYPQLLVQPISADYTQGCDVPDVGQPERRVAFFPGSTIGNFSPDAATAFLRHVHDIVGADGGLLIGVDLKKDSSVLHAAYNDKDGVTAAFNVNLLHRIHRELDAQLNLEGFDHQAFFNEDQSRIEMHLKAHGQQKVMVDGRQFVLQDGETIHTENSYKYSLDDFARLARSAGFSKDQTWMDDKGLFSIHYLTTQKP